MDSLSADELRILRQQMDRTAIRETLERYMAGADRQNAELIASVYTDDAEGQFDAPDGVSYRKGGAAMAAGVVSGVSAHHYRSHSIANVHIVLNGDNAHADTYCIGYHVVGSGTPEAVRTRGIRYLDELVRLPEGWRIHKRVHKLLWQCETAAVPLRPSSERFTS